MNEANGMLGYNQQHIIRWWAIKEIKLTQGINKSYPCPEARTYNDLLMFTSVQK